MPAPTDSVSSEPPLDDSPSAARPEIRPVLPADGAGAESPADLPDPRDSSLWRWRGPVSLVGAVLFAVLGWLVVAGKLAHGGDEALANARPAELVQILDSVESDISRLEAERRALQAEIDALQTGTAEEAVENARARLEALQILAGTTPVAGPGIRMVITDHDGGLSADVVLDVMAELRDAGAESIEFAGRRVVLNSWFADGPDGEGGVSISGDLRRSPYVIQAIGNAATLSTAMGIPGGVADTVRTAGADFELEERPGIKIDSVVAAANPQYAKPAS
ncbi:MAG: DUF881 domain-containing protein [Candidatus Nanopelagicales bacterium]